jgi:secretion/DNA translocation related CpaE-like protein
MSATSGVLAMIGDAALRGEVDRVAAAAGVAVIHVSEPSSRRVWAAAAAVLLDNTAARRCALQALPRRARVLLVVRGDPEADDLQAAISIGAQHVLSLPRQDAELVAQFSDVVDSTRDGGRDQRRGPVVAVLGARGGAGATVFAAALGHSAAAALLVDVDPWSGGVDLVVGIEHEPGLRWPDLTIQGGRLSNQALRDALPRRDGVSVLSGGRAGGDVDAIALAAVVDAGRRGGETVICDLPRQSSAAVETALDVADLVVMCTPADVRSCAAAAAMAPWATSTNPNVGLVVRGPSPGGLRAAEVARIVGLPLLAKMRAQPRIADELERGGLRLTQRSPLAVAARRVLAVLEAHHAAEAA